jgi:SAM-dependent methyltransferase
MDAPGHDPAVIADNLNDLRRVNRILGGIRLTRVPLGRLVASLPVSTPVKVLDVASGAADIPAAIARRAAIEGRPLFVVASDLSLQVLQAARAHDPTVPGMVYVVADATCLPFPDRSFHAVTCSLALHHMLDHEAVAMLRELQRCATLGIVVNDIVRSWLTYFGAVFAVRVGSRNVLTRHDGPLSARRAFTMAQMRSLAAQAGLRPIRWDSFLWYRIAMTAV